MNLTILCIGAHADDIEIGCAATLLGMIRAGRVARAHWFVLSARDVRFNEAKQGAVAILDGVRDREVDIAEFRDGYFPAQFNELKNRFETLKQRIEPDLVFTHRHGDKHQDHRVVADLTWQTFRNHTVLEYEIPKYDGDLSTPNVYVPVSAEDLAAKWNVLNSCYQSQADRHWFCSATFESLARLRGLECRSTTAFAEGFFARKLLWTMFPT